MGILDDIGHAAASAAGALSKPSAAAEASFAELKRRWEALDAWQVAKKLPNVKLQIDAWRDFSGRWIAGYPDVPALNPSIADLNVVEAYAKKKGFAPGAGKLAGLDLEVAIDTPDKRAKNAAVDAAQVVVEDAEWLAKKAAEGAKTGLPILETLVVLGLLGAGVAYWAERRAASAVLRTVL